MSGHSRKTGQLSQQRCPGYLQFEKSLFVNFESFIAANCMNRLTRLPQISSEEVGGTGMVNKVVTNLG